MTDAAAISSRIFIRYAGASKDCLPTEVDIREIFSTYGSIVGMLYGYFYHNLLYYYFL